MITIGQIFDNIFCLNKCVNGIIYNDDCQNDVKYKFYTSRYMMNQVFNYVFKNTFEHLDPAYGEPDINITRKIISSECETQDLCTQIITKSKPIIQAMHCVLRNCNPSYYGEEYVHDIIFKHGKPLDRYNELVHKNIYKHHVVLRKHDNNKNSTHKEQTGDWLIYLKQEKLIKFIMLCQHPDILINNLQKMPKITSKNSIKVDKYYSDMNNYKKSNEAFKWTFDDQLYFIQKIAITKKMHLNSKEYNKMKTKSIDMHKSLISNLINQLLKIDPILTQNP